MVPVSLQESDAMASAIVPIPKTRKTAVSFTSWFFPSIFRVARRCFSCNSNFIENYSSFFFCFLCSTVVVVLFFPVSFCLSFDNDLFSSSVYFFLYYPDFRFLHARAVYV